MVAGYRLAVNCDQAAHGILHVSADERFELYVDGLLVGRGPERGDPEHWAFHSFSVDLEPGQHWIAARVWSLGEEAPYAQLSVGTDFSWPGRTSPAAWPTVRWTPGAPTGRPRCSRDTPPGRR